MWPLLLVFLLNPKGGIESAIAVVAGGIALFSLIGSVIEYFRFYYWISNDHLVIERGFLRKIKLNIPFERIQSIDFEQNMIHQAFRVVRVKVDSAGSSQQEASFDALQLEEAEILRDYILAQKAELRHEDASAVMADEQRELILHLKPLDLLKIGVSQNHLRTAGIILAFFFALAEDIDEALKNIDLFGQIEHELEMLARSSLLLVLVAIPFFLLISFMVSLIRTVFVYYDMQFWKTGTGFKLRSGLITKREKSAQKDKIQLIVWSTNPLRKIFGIFKLSLYQASSVDVIGDKSIAVPGCYKSHVDQAVASAIPGAPGAAYEEHRIHPSARFRFILFAGLLPCFLITIAGIVFDRQLAFAVWLYLPIAIWMGHLYYRKKRLLLHRDLTMLKGGIISDEFRLLETYKVQAVSVTQTFFQWRRDLATVSLFTASGSVSIPFIPIRKAEQIRDYLLYRIESDPRNWM
jgi:putative membrane protein